MGKTFDRYVLHRFVFLFVGFYAAAMGLFAVVDGFTNLDEFQQRAAGDGSLALLSYMARNYAYRSGWVFDLIGPTLATMAVVGVLALLVRHGEINPLLAAGVPTYRLAFPFLAGMLLVHVALALNKELVLPRIAVHLTGQHAIDGRDGRHVEPARDSRQGIFVSGRELIPATGVLRDAEFRLSRSPLVAEVVSLRASEAKYYPRKGRDKPAGWVLRQPTPAFNELLLTEQGRQAIVPQPNGTDIFVKTDVTADQLYDKGTSFHYLSTPELLRRVQRPVAGTPLLRAQVLHLHSRLTRPLMNVVGVFLVIPLIVRRESRSLVTNIAVCMAALAAVVGLTETFQFLGGKIGFVSVEAATWMPLILGGGLCAWLSPRVQT